MRVHLRGSGGRVGTAAASDSTCTAAVVAVGAQQHIRGSGGRAGTVAVAACRPHRGFVGPKAPYARFSVVLGVL